MLHNINDQPTDDIVCSLDPFEEAQATSSDLNVAAGRYVPSKCKVRLTDWTAVITPLTLSDEELTFVDSTNASRNIADEITSRSSKARAVHGNLRHIWSWTDISLTTKGRVYNCTVCATLIYGCETWPIRAEDLHHQRLRTYLLKAEDKQ